MKNKMSLFVLLSSLSLFASSVFAYGGHGHGGSWGGGHRPGGGWGGGGGWHGHPRPPIFPVYPRPIYPRPIFPPPVIIDPNPLPPPVIIPQPIPVPVDPDPLPVPIEPEPLPDPIEEPLPPPIEQSNPEQSYYCPRSACQMAPPRLPYPSAQVRAVPLPRNYQVGSVCSVRRLDRSFYEIVQSTPNRRQYVLYRGVRENVNSMMNYYESNGVCNVR